MIRNEGVSLRFLCVKAVIIDSLSTVVGDL